MPHERRIGDRAAAVLLGLETLGLLALVLWQLVALVTGDTTDLGSAIALVVLTAICAVIVGMFSAVVWRGLSWGRSGGIVTQLLVLSVAIGAVATGPDPQPGVAVALAVPAVVTLILLVCGVRQAGERRRRDSADAEQ